MYMYIYICLINIHIHIYIYICRPKQTHAIALKHVDTTDLFFTLKRQVDNFSVIHSLGNFLKEMTLNIVKGFLPPLISCCNNGAVPLSEFVSRIFCVSVNG